MTQPAVSVNMPAFNAGAFLEPAVRSILAQTFTDFELLVIDDGSTDGSVERITAISDPRIRILRNARNLGIVASRNRAIAESRAPLIAILDSDDIAHPHRLARQVSAFEQDPRLGLVGCVADLIDATGRVFGMTGSVGTDAELRRDLVQGNRFVHSTVMMRTEAVRAAGGYRPEFEPAEDYALFLQIMLADYRLLNLPERLVQYRVHTAQVSQRKLIKQRACVDAARGQASRQIVATGREAEFGVFQRDSAGLLSRLCAGPGTLGADFLYWARIHRQMDNWPGVLDTGLRGLRHAPLSWSLVDTLLPTKLNPVYWVQRLSGR
jgi:glycosyltransferase involved in cell wall biosynthesis